MSSEALVAAVESVLARLSAIEDHLGIAPAAVGGGGGGAKKVVKEDPRSIKAYDQYLRENLDPFVEAANQLGGDAVALGELVKEAWTAQRDFLYMASAVKEPAQPKLVAKLAPIQAVIQKANKSIKRGDFENHGKTVAEGMQCLTWLAVKPAPRDFIENFVGASDFWANKIRVQYKKTAPPQTAFVDNFKKLILELMAYVKEYHTTGVTWNPQGVDIDAYAPGAAEEAPKTAAPVAPAKPTAAPPTSSDGGKKALFGDLSKGLDITSGLKKVSKDQQTWRPEFKTDDKAAPPPPAPTKKPTTTTPKVAVAKGPPVSSYNESQFKWSVENYDQGVNPIQVGDKNQSVYVYNCGASVIDVKGKGKSVILDTCKRTQVLIDEMVSSVEVVNCHNVKVQIRGKCPTVAIDKSDGVHFHLSKEALNTVFTTSKSSEMNIQYPRPDGEMGEVPIPEQYTHRIKTGGPNLSLTTDVSDLYSH